MPDMLYKVEDVAEAVNIAASTIRKYSALIEKHSNYEFTRSNQGSFLYTDSEITLFRDLIKLKNKKGMTLEKSVEQLFSTKEEVAATSDMVRMADIQSIVAIQLRSMVGELTNQNKAVYEKLNSIEEKRKKEIEENERRQTEQMLEIRELRKEIRKSKKQRWWQRLGQ